MRKILILASSALALLSACGQQTAPVTDAKAPAESHAEHDHAGPVGISATQAAPFQAGKTATLTLRLTDQEGRPIVADDLARVHDHLLHVMIVDAGLDDYSHAHPTANPNGTFSVAFTPRLDRPYRLWADFTLKGGAKAEKADEHGHSHAPGEEHAETRVDPSFASTDLRVGVGAVPPFAAPQSLTTEAGGLRFQLSLSGALKAGRATPVTLAVVGADGAPFAQLEPVMGAFAHVVGFNPGATKMLHVHPEGAEPRNAGDRGGPVVAFTLTPRSAGPQRLFVQVKAGGKEVFAPFTLDIAP